MRSLLFLAVFTACNPLLTPEPVGCEAFTTRCDGQLAQVCAPSQGWRTAQDCRLVTPTSLNWRCCPTSEGRFSCLPAEECDDPR